MKTLRFFALNADILTILRSVESNMGLLYSRYGNFSETDYMESLHEFDKCEAIPKLGNATGSQVSSSDAFVVCDKRERVVKERFATESGVLMVAVDQRFNPNSIVLRPCGLWDENTVLAGNVGTASDSVKSLMLMRFFEKAFRKTFIKVKAYYVGPLAHQMLISGKRLACAAIESPTEFDLQL